MRVRVRATDCGLQMWAVARCSIWAGRRRAWHALWQSWSWLFVRYGPTLCGCGFCCCHLPLRHLPLSHFSLAAALKFKACNFMLLIFRSIKSCGFGSHKLHCWEPSLGAPPPAPPASVASPLHHYAAIMNFCNICCEVIVP